MSYARAERLALCRLLAQLGPNAPTLCAGWDAHDLAAHLVLRERRPDAAIGILARPLSGYTEFVRATLRRDTPLPRLVELLRTGPPWWSPWALPGMDAGGNLVEFFVHHEDVRRADAQWQPRELDATMQLALWKRLGMTRFVLRRLPTGLRLSWSNDGTRAGPTRTVKAGEPAITVSGSPPELTLWATGRTSVARVELHGDNAALERLAAARWGL